MPYRDSYSVTLEPPARRGPQNISIARLPVTGSDVFGREEDIAFLNDAWENPHANVATIVAWAGVGKSTLVNHWLRGMAAEDYRSAQLVFGWSFYRQGSRGDTSSADEFLDEVRVTVSASDSMKREVLSFLTRELRALGDIEVEVVDTAPRYQIEVVALETSSRASTVPTGYAVSAIVTSPVYLGLLKEYGIAFSGQHWARATEAMADLGCSPARESRHQLPHVSPGRTGSND